MNFVNRQLNDKMFDHIDHALGRPLDPTGDTKRDHFCADINGAEHAMFAASPFWFQGRLFEDMVYFHVSAAGRQALKDHLRDIGDANRLWSIAYDGYEMSQVAATRSKARYLKWMDISDARDVPFKEFAKHASVKLSIQDPIVVARSLRRAVIH
jgi:hypothetical protein